MRRAEVPNGGAGATSQSRCARLPPIVLWRRSRSGLQKHGYARLENPQATRRVIFRWNRNSRKLVQSPSAGLRNKAGANIVRNDSHVIPGSRRCAESRRISGLFAVAPPQLECNEG